jgi:hypothetical protein
MDTCAIQVDIIIIIIIIVVVVIIIVVVVIIIIISSSIPTLITPVLHQPILRQRHATPLLSHFIHLDLNY